MTRATELTSAAELILHEPAPVLLLDTCALLDIIRCPMRQNIPCAVVEYANALVSDASATPPRVYIIAAEAVVSEWDNHRERVTEVVSAFIKGMDAEMERLHKAAREILGTSVPAPYLAKGATVALKGLSLPSVSRTPLMNIISGSAMKLIDSAIEVIGSPECVAQARARVMAGRPPSYLGRQQYSDCEILETYLTLSKLLKEGGHAEPRVFVSSNVNDYCQGRKAYLHHELAAEFETAGLQFATHLVWARSLMSNRCSGANN